MNKIMTRALYHMAGILWWSYEIVSGARWRRFTPWELKLFLLLASKGGYIRRKPDS